MMPLPDVLTATEGARVNLRAQRIYSRTTQVLAWANIAESTRTEFRRRATNEMWLDGSLLLDPVAGADDDGCSGCECAAPPALCRCRFRR